MSRLDSPSYPSLCLLSLLQIRVQSVKCRSRFCRSRMAMRVSGNFHRPQVWSTSIGKR